MGVRLGMSVARRTSFNSKRSEPVLTINVIDRATGGVVASFSPLWVFFVAVVVFDLWLFAWALRLPKQ